LPPSDAVAVESRLTKKRMLMKTTKLIPLICLIALSVVAQDNRKKKSGSSAGAPAAAENQKPGARVDLAITTTEREIIRGYCAQFEQPGKKGRKTKSLPPGLAKKVARGGKLPPGWEKRLVKGEVIPEPVLKECHPLPKEVVIKLPVPPPETILRAIEGKIVRLHEKTREILDVFDPFH
jgi:hypothetical protein